MTKTDTCNEDVEFRSLLSSYYPFKGWPLSAVVDRNPRLYRMQRNALQQLPIDDQTDNSDKGHRNCVVVS